MNKSYVKIVCTEDADPKYNRLQLRTEPSTFIHLQPGENILSVEEYSDLKYGFKQLDDPRLDAVPDATNEYNCGDVLLVDLSHFDSTEMTAMDMMFCRMENLKNIIFGDSRIENITSMKSAFEWTAVEELDLTSINFSEVVDAEMMTYSQGNLRVNLTGCDLSKVIVAEGIFNGVAELNLDGVMMSEAIVEAMRWDAEGGCEDLKKISMKGCDIRMVSSVIKNLNFLRTRIELNNIDEDKILNYISHSLPIPWTQIDPCQWYLTIISGRVDNDNAIQQLILENLKRKTTLEDFKYIETHPSVTQDGHYYSWETVYRTGTDFPMALIKTFFDYRLGIITTRCSRESYSFVVGNAYAAFSNNPKLKYYVPGLFRGFESIVDILGYVRNSTPYKQSNIRILEIQYLNPSDNPTVLTTSKVWSQANTFRDSDILVEKPSLIKVPAIDWFTFFKSIEETTAPIVERIREEMGEIISSNTEEDENDVFDPDFEIRE